MIDQNIAELISPNNAINPDVKHARASGAHVYAAGYGSRYVIKRNEVHDGK